MKNNFKIATLSILFTFIFSSILFCQTNNLLTGAERTTEYLPLLKGKNIGLVVNQTSMIGSIHLNYRFSNHISDYKCKKNIRTGTWF